MRFTVIALLLGGCAASLPGGIGFDGSWHGTWNIAFSGSQYQMRGRTGHFASDANNLYFTENGATASVTCPYTLMGDALILRDCPFAGEYRR